MATVSNENANGVFLDVVHDAHFTFIPFYSTRINVILFVLIRKSTAFSAHIFTKLANTEGFYAHCSCSMWAG